MQDMTVAVGLSWPSGSGGGGLVHPACPPASKIVPTSAAMRRVLELVAKIAPGNSAVLIRGEPGVGKETVAREIHRRSSRARRPWVRVSCAAMREGQLEHELFGVSEGRGSPDEPRPPGLLARADHGTLFLKDVADLPLWAQVKLLEALRQDGDGPGGTGGDAPLDARVIATTTSDPAVALGKGRFWAGLYYHLAVVEIWIPPLRHRREDIRPLVESFLAQINCAPGVRPRGAEYRFSEKAWQQLLAHEWPGNVSEVASVVARAVALADGAEIGTDCVEGSLRKTDDHRDCETIAVPLTGGLDAIGRRVVRTVIDRCHGNKAAAARVLGIHRRTLYRLLQQDTLASGAAAAE